MVLSHALKLAMAGNDRTSPEGRLRTIWRRLVHRRDPAENIVAVNRLIDEANRRARRAFQRACREVEQEESSAEQALIRNLGRRPPVLDAFDAAVAEMEQSIRSVRSAGREAKGHLSEVDEARLADRQRVARENLERLEGDLKELATRRDEEAEQTNK
jgi:hypothetical protein